MEGIKNLLMLVNANWTTILVVIGLAIGLFEKVKKYMKLSKEEKVNIAKTLLVETMLSSVSDAEENYAEWAKSGSMKRSEVIRGIYEEYPILKQVKDQDALIKYIDDAIDMALPELRRVLGDAEMSE